MFINHPAYMDDNGNPLENLYFAVQHDTDDPWDDGSWNLQEAIALAKEYIKDGYSAFIAVIDHADADPFCIGTIEEEQFDAWLEN